MMSGLLIRGGTIVNEGESYRGWIVVKDERIARTGRGDYPRPEFDGETIDAEGMYVLPGVIDDQVHFREPGLTYKGDLHSESIAAAAGGVTSYMDMPNVKPPTVTNALLEEKLERAAETSVVNYSFYLGATVDNIDEIIEAADGIMIARGDMGVEIPPEYVPVIQQKIIQKVYTAGKPVITATQMLDSMISHPRPTRAEATDVANAIFQGTSATMLSGETAAGKYPVQALQMMSRIAEHMEQNIDYNTIFKKTDRNENPDITNAIAHATCLTAIDLKASAILAVTKSGSTAHMMSKHRPGCLIGACTSSERVLRQLNLSWGVYPMLIKEEYSSEILCLRAIEAAQKHKLVKVGDTVVFAGGVPLGIPGRTNMIRVCIVE